MPKVTHAQASQILADLHALYPFSVGNAELYDADHEELEPGSWSIGWEAGYDWTVEFSERVKTPEGVYIESRNHWSIGIYPA